MSSEVLRRIAITLGALLIYRLGTYVPIPGIEANGLATIFRGVSRSLWSTANLASGGAIRRVAILSLGILPYVSAAVVLQLVAIPWRSLRALQYQGEQGRRRVEIYTLCLTIVFAVLEALGIALALESIPGGFVDAGLLFRVSTVATLTGGTMVLVWLSRLITAHGVGNGLALILATGIVIELPSTIARTLELGHQGLLSNDALLVSLLIAIAATACIVFMEGARRRLPVDYAERDVGTRRIGGRSHLVMKLNAAGIIPPLVAGWLLALLVLFVTYDARLDPSWWRTIAEQLKHGQPLYLIAYGLLIVLGAFVYTAFVFDPDQTAESLKEHGGAIPGIEPGLATAEHVDYVLSRTTVVGAIYLALVCLIPELLIDYVGVPFYLGGASLLIVVCTVMDVKAQVEGAVA